MTSYRRLALVLLVTLVGCEPAQSPLKSGDGATFAIFPDRVKASAELNRASKTSFGKASSQILHFNVCLQSLATGQPVANGARFSIGDGTGTGLSRAADPNGCVHWDEEHKVSPLAPERNLRVERHITALDNHRGTVTLAFNVKPWLEGGDAVQSALNQEKFADAIDTAGRLTFASEYPTTDGSPAAKAEGESQRSSFDIADNQVELTYVANGRSPEFEIDPFLNLAVPYRFNFAFAPRITRRAFSGAPRSDIMTSGKLKVTFVFFASGRDDFKLDSRYLTSTQVEAEIGANGRVSGTMQIKYPHLMFASGRQTVLIQISAPDQTDVQARSFSGSLSVIDHRGALITQPDGRDAEVIHVDSIRERASRAQARLTPLKEYVKSHDVTYTDLTEFPDEAARDANSSMFGGLGNMLSAQEMRQALAEDNLDASSFFKNSIASRLCHTFVKMNPALDYKQPVRDFKADYLASLHASESSMGNFYCGTGAVDSERVSVRQLDFVEKIKTSPRNVEIRTFGNMDFGIYYGKDTVDTKEIGTGFGIRGSAGVSTSVGPYSAGISADIEAHASRSRSWTSSTGGRFGQSQSLVIDVGQMDVQASVRHCVLIKGLNAPFTHKAWLICDSKVEAPHWIHERFYYFSQIFGSNHSPLLDPFDAQSGMKFFVRGRHRIKHITQRLQDADIRETGFDLFINSHAPELNEIDTLDKTDELTDQTVPGAFERN